MTNNPNLRACLRCKKIFINRGAIKLLGNPTHLSFQYDNLERVLFVAPANSKDLDAFEIPYFYWHGTNKQCEIARIAFLRALQYRLGWKDGSKYCFSGTVTVLNETQMIVFPLTGESVDWK